MTVTDLPLTQIETGFANALRGREERFPILARAAFNIWQTQTPGFAWVVPDKYGCDTALINHCQIARTPFSYSHINRDEALDRHFEIVEGTLVHGIPRHEQGGLRTCGGVRHYLGRDISDGDTINLVVMRDLALLTNRQIPGEERIDEWLSEFTLRVYSAEAKLNHRYPA